MKSTVTLLSLALIATPIAAGQTFKYVQCSGTSVSAYSAVVNGHGRGEEIPLTCGQKVEVVKEDDNSWSVIRLDHGRTAFLVSYFLADKKRDEKSQQRKVGSKTIEVVSSQLGVRELAWYIPGSPGYSRTNCSSTGTASGSATTIGDTTFGNATANGNTTCQTTYTPPTEASTTYSYINQVWVYAIVDDAHMKLWCQKQFRDCRILQAGHYEAESKGDFMFIVGRDPGGKAHRIKYRVVDTW